MAINENVFGNTSGIYRSHGKSNHLLLVLYEVHLQLLVDISVQIETFHKSLYIFIVHKPSLAGRPVEIHLWCSAGQRKNQKVNRAQLLER